MGGALGGLKAMLFANLQLFAVALLNTGSLFSPESWLGARASCLFPGAASKP